MAFAVTVGVVALALLAGGMAGVWLGARVRGRSAAYWGLNALAVVVCMLVDFAGLVLGYAWLAYGSIGLMAGLITGLKYGYSDAMRVWRSDGTPGDAGERNTASGGPGDTDTASGTADTGAQDAGTHDDPAAG